MIHHIAIDMNRIWLITTEIQTNKSFYSLTKDARGVPQESAKMQPPQGLENSLPDLV